MWTVVSNREGFALAGRVGTIRAATTINSDKIFDETPSTHFCSGCIQHQKKLTTYHHHHTTKSQVIKTKHKKNIIKKVH